MLSFEEIFSCGFSIKDEDWELLFTDLNIFDQTLKESVILRVHMMLYFDR